MYAWALDKLLKEEERPLTDKVIRDVASNGTRIIETIIKNRTYKSKRQRRFNTCIYGHKTKNNHFAGVTGSTIKIDSSGDSEGNFSVLALKPYKMTRDNFSCDLHMVPVAYFQQGENFPVSEFFFHYSLVLHFEKIVWSHFCRFFPYHHHQLLLLLLLFTGIQNYKCIVAYRLARQ